jgi:hypothetical protein
MTGPFDQWARNWLGFVSSATAAAGNTAARMLPVDPFAPLIDVVRKRLIGRRRSFRVEDREVSFVLAGLKFDTGELLRAVGQYGEVALTLEDLEWEQGRVERLEVRACNVHVRPAVSPELVTAPVQWEAHVSAEQVTSWCARLAPALTVTIGEDGVRVGLAARLPGTRLHLEPFADGRSIRLVPRALQVGQRRLGLRLPGYSVPLRELSPDVLVTEVELDGHRAIIRGLRTEWRPVEL